jgi:uncharacterized protein YabE (DUF348 family)
LGSVRATRVRRLRIRKAIQRSTLAAVVLSAGLAYLALEKRVTLVVDGRPEAVRTLSSNVGQLLAGEGIALRAGDLVQPPPGTPLADGMTVVVDRDGVHGVQIDSRGVGVWVVEGPAGPFAKLAVRPIEDLSSAGGFVEPSRVLGARVVVMGKERDVLTNAATVRELLSAMGIRFDDRDRVLPPPSTPLKPSLRVRVVDIDVGVRQVEQPIPPTTVTTYTFELPPGEVRVTQAGRPGVLLEAWRVRRVDGEVVSRELLWRRVVRPAVPTQRLVGARVNEAHGVQVGEASWYHAPGTGFTAAHPWLPFGTVVTVTNLDNGRRVTVTINDRGPFGGRIIDLSEEAFAAIAPLGQGVADVRLTW